NEVGLVESAPLSAVLPCTKSRPAFVIDPGPFSVAFDSDTTPFALIWLPAPRPRVLLESASVCVPDDPPNCSPAIVSLTSNVTVYVPGSVMIAMSVGPGTAPPLQFAGLLQFPPAGFDQAIVPAAATISKVALVALV